MRKRTNSQHSLSNIQTPNPRGTATSNPGSQTYLHMLKLSSTAYKASKLINFKKPETLTSLLKSANTRVPLSNKSESGNVAAQKINSLLTSFTPNTTSHRANNASITLDLRPMNTRASQKVEAKGPTAPRNSSEPRLKANTSKNNEKNSQQQKFLSGSFCVTEDPNQQGEKVERGFSSVGFPQRHHSVASIELPGNIGLFNDKNVVSQDAKSSGSTSNLDQSISGQKHVIHSMQKKPSQGSIQDFFSESFENYKDYKTPSEDSDSKTEDRCMNHPQKRAKYYTTSEDDASVQYKLCSKCAVALADKGAKVREIINSEEELRRSEIEGFMIKVSHSRRNSKSIVDSLGLKKSDFIEFFSKQNEKVDAIAAALETIIKEEVGKAKNSFEMQKSQIISMIESLEKKLKSESEEIDEMQVDIERNLENILKHIGLKPFKKIINSYQHRLQDFDVYLESIRGQKVEVSRLPGVKPKHVQELRPNLQAFFELRECKTSILKRTDGYEEKNSEDSSRQANRSSLYISFENNKAAFESARGSIFETQREGDRFSFACDQSAILKAVKQAEGYKTASSTGLDTETSSQALKTPLARRISDDLLENMQLRRKSSLKQGDDSLQSANRLQVDKGELAVVYSRRSSCPSNSDVTIVLAESTDRDQISPLCKTTGTKSVGKFPVFPENSISDQAQCLQEYYSLPVSKGRSDRKDWNDDDAPEIEMTESMVRNNQAEEDQSPRREEEDKNVNLLSASEKKLSCNPFARRKPKKSDPIRQSKSQNSSFNIIKDVIVLNSTIDQSHYEGPYRSPNFKENSDK